MIATFLAILACLILTFLAVFQLALALGAPFGHYAWGGSHRVLPTNLRISSIFSILLYAVFSIVILEGGGLITIFGDITLGLWALAAYFLIGVVMNVMSRSPKERLVMTPVAALLALICGALALL
jgi:hypothetical protein